MAKSQKEMIEELECMVDEQSLGCVILALARMCDEKSEHILINWPDDKSLMRDWSKVARKLDNVANETKL